MNIDNQNPVNKERQIDLKLVDIEGTLCVVITGITVEKLEQDLVVYDRVKEAIARLIEANRNLGWKL